MLTSAGFRAAGSHSVIEADKPEPVRRGEERMKRKGIEGERERK